MWKSKKKNPTKQKTRKNSENKCEAHPFYKLIADKE